MKSLAVVFWLFSSLCASLWCGAASSGQDPRVLAGLKKTNTAILSYSSNGNELHLEILTGEGCQLLCLPAGKDFPAQLRKMNSSLRTKSDFDRQLAYRLYTVLVEPARRYLAGKKHLIIIPDQTTGLIPFEALVPDTSSGEYLLHEYAISYAAGYDALANPTQPLSDYQRQKVLAIAPFDLPAAEKEIMNIQADYLLGGAASLQKFRQKAKDYSIIHLATRAATGDRSHSFIDFSPANAPPGGRPLSSFRLDVRDIDRLNLRKVHLLILSPCQLINGSVSIQGLLGMASAFARAGCPNFIGMRWSTHRETSDRIFMKLHGYINQGYGYASALQKARIDYLENPAVEDRLKAPGYWSGFTLLGEINTTSPSHKIFYYFALILTVLTVILILRRKKVHRPAC